MPKLSTYAKSSATAAALKALAGRAVDVETYGAVGDGTTNDTPAFAAAFAALGAAGGRVRAAGDKRYLIDTTFTLPKNCALEGDFINPGRQPGSPPSSFDALGSTLVVNSSATIKASYSNSITGFVIMRKGMGATPFANAGSAATEVAAFAGTAIQIGEDASPDVPVQDVHLGHLLILGFQYAVFAYKVARIRAEYVSFDCTNGIMDEIDTDISHFNFCHGWPFLTTHLNDAPTLARSGTGFRTQNIGDWVKFTNCFTYGYAIGFDINNADHATLIGCGTDYRPGANTAIGYYIRGTSKETGLIGCQAAAVDKAVVIDIGTATEKKTARVLSMNIWECRTSGVELVTGTASVVGCNISGAMGKHVRVLVGATAFSMSDNTLDALDNPVAINAAVTNVKTTNTTCLNATPGTEWRDRVSVVDVQDFAASGTWTKPDGAKFVEVIVVGSGGGGGSGRRGAADSDRSGGGGGSGGGMNRGKYAAADLPSTVTVTVGVAGPGGTAIAANDTNGNTGTAGGNTTFGDFIRAIAGLAGVGGTTTAGTGGAGVTQRLMESTGTVAGSTGGAGANVTGASVANKSELTPAAGAGGGGISAANAAAAGGVGQGIQTSIINTTVGGGASGAAGAAGGPGASVHSYGAPIGTGGGGGGGHATTAGVGGAGGSYGAGGGGGGASANGAASGAGGAGGGGLCRVVTYF